MIYLDLMFTKYVCFASSWNCNDRAVFLVVLRKKKYLVNRIAKYETMAYEYTIAKSKYRWVVIEEFTCRQMNYNEIAICKWNHWNVS
jgi:hypothetical protein